VGPPIATIHGSDSAERRTIVRILDGVRIGYV
jgi:hypothetical protein